MTQTRQDTADDGAVDRDEPQVDPYVQLQATEEFQVLRRRFRSFVFPMTAFFLTWYFLYVLAAIFAPAFMSVRLWGTINVGLVFGLLQFVTTFAITFIYALSMALVLGTAGLPHVLIRFYTVPTSKQARKSVEWAIWLIGGFYLLTLVVGYGAAALVGPDTINAAPGKANSAAPLLAYELGGSVLLGVISGIAFATILAVVAGLTIASSATFAHDLYNYVLRDGQATPEEEVKVARWAAVAIGVVAILGGILAYGQNIAFLVALAFAVAASANLPTILYSLFWSRFNTRGALWSIYGGLASSLLLITFSPVVSGSETAMITDPAVDFSVFPLANPGIISIPLAFFLGWLGTVTSPKTHAQKWAEVEVRSLTGHGVAEAVDH